MKNLLMKTFMLLSFILLFQTSFAEEKKVQTYKINFKNVPVIEYINFVSKVSQSNFLYDEADLAFNVTVVSDEEIPSTNAMATLLQILRIHGLTLLQDDKNLVIHKNPEVKQLAKIVTEKTSLDGAPPIVTKVFRIRNSKVDSVANIIKPMISTDALLEVSFETRQIIISDVTSNIKKVSDLIEVIDSPQNPLEIEIYKAKVNQPSTLIDLTNQIITPLTEGAPFILVPQDPSGSIYIISTPKLIEKAFSVLASLDVASKTEIKKTLRPANIFVYKLIHQPGSTIERFLNEMVTSLQSSGYGETGLLEILKSAKWIKETNSFLFTGSEESIAKVQEILTKIDVVSLGVDGQRNNFIIFRPTDKPSSEMGLYKIQNASPNQLIAALRNTASTLKKADVPEKNLINAIESVKHIEGSNTLIFTGDAASLKQIQELLPSFDYPGKGTELLNETYYLYKLQYVPGNIIEEDLENFADNLQKQNIKNPEIINTIQNANWIKETNSLMLTGTPKAIEEVKQLIEKYDIPHRQELTSRTNFFIYKPKFASPSLIEDSLKDTVANLQKAQLADPDFISAVNNMKIIDSTRSLAFTGSEKAIEKIKALIANIDTPSAGEIVKPGTTYILYKVLKASPFRLISSLKTMAGDLTRSGASDKDLIDALNSMKYQPDTKSILVTGSPASLEKVKVLLEKYDSAELSEPMVVTEGVSSYYVYKPKYMSGPSLENILRNFVDHLKTTGFDNPSLFSSIQNMKWDEETKSLIFSGNEKAISEIKTLINTYDIQGKEPTAVSNILQESDETSFLVYKLQYHKGDDIQTALKQIGKEFDLGKTNVKKNLINAINSVQWIQITNSLLASGEKEVLTKIKDLISSLDVPLKQVFIEMLVIETSLTNLLNFGLDWASKYKHKNKFVAGMANTTPVTNPPDQFPAGFNPISATNPPTGTSLPLFSSTGFDLGVIGDIIMHKGKSFLSLGSLLKAIQEDEETTVVMTPKLLTQDGKQSSIFIGQNLPYIGSQTVIQAPSSSTTQNLEYRDVGMNLILTPVLGNSDTVTLDINLDRTIAAPGSATNQTLTGVQGIVTSKTNMLTTVHIPDKSFLVLSGMVTETKSKIKSGIPCLGGLPLIGAAFSESDSQTDKKNIVIFIRPHIINSYQDMQRVSENQEDFFRESLGSPNIEETYEDSIESIKTDDDE